MMAFENGSELTLSTDGGGWSGGLVEELAIRRSLPDLVYECKQSIPAVVEGIARLMLGPATLGAPLPNPNLRHHAARFFALRDIADEAVQGIPDQKLAESHAADLYNKTIVPLLDRLRDLSDSAFGIATDRLDTFVIEARQAASGSRADRQGQAVLLAVQFRLNGFVAAITEDQIAGYERTSHIELFNTRAWIRTRIDLLDLQHSPLEDVLSVRRLVDFLTSYGVACDLTDTTPDIKLSERRVFTALTIAVRTLSDVWYTRLFSALANDSHGTTAFLASELSRGYPLISMRERPGSADLPSDEVSFDLALQIPADWTPAFTGAQPSEFNLDTLGLCVSNLQATIGRLNGSVRSVQCVAANRTNTGQPDMNTVTIEIAFRADSRADLKPTGIDPSCVARKLAVAQDIAGVASARASHLIALPPDPAIQQPAPGPVGTASRRAFSDASAVGLVRAGWRALRSFRGVENCLFYFDEFRLFDHHKTTTVVLLNYAAPSWLFDRTKAQAALRAAVEFDGRPSVHRITAGITLDLRQAADPVTLLQLRRILELEIDTVMDLRIFWYAGSDAFRSFVTSVKRESQLLTDRFGTGKARWKVIVEPNRTDSEFDPSGHCSVSFHHPSIVLPVDSNFSFWSGAFTSSDTVNPNRHRLPPNLADVLVQARKAAALHGIPICPNYLAAELANLGISATSAFCEFVCGYPLQSGTDDAVNAQKLQGAMVSALQQNRLDWRASENGYCLNYST